MQDTFVEVVFVPVSCIQLCVASVCLLIYATRIHRETQQLDNYRIL